MKCLRSIRPTLLSASLLLLACVTPMYDRAEIQRGFSAGLGPSGGAGYTVVGFYDWGLIPGAYCDVAGTGFVRYGFGDAFELGLQATVEHLSVPIHLDTTNASYDDGLQAELAGKFRTSEGSALKLGLTYPGVLSGTYLHDFGPQWTGSIGLSPAGVAAGVVWHHRISDRFQGHASLRAQVPLPAFQLGYAVEWLSHGSPAPR